MKVRYAFFGAMTVLALVISSCTALAGQFEPSILRIGWTGSPDTLNPGAAEFTEADTIFGLVYDTMYQMQMDGTFKLILAENVTVSEDGLIYTYKIRDGVKFHDGEPLTAQDVVFSYLLYKNTQGYPWMGAYTYYFENIEATENNEVVITLSNAIPNIDAQLAFLYVLPRHIWKSQDALEFDNLQTIGSGPFKMVEYRQDQIVHLAANRDYFGGSPKVDEVIFQRLENEGALVQAITAGDVDMITKMPGTAVASLQQDPNIQVVTGGPLSPGVTDIIINQVSSRRCPPDNGLCTGHPALLDRNVRLALAHATDKRRIIDVVKLGMGTPGTTLIPEGMGFWYNSSLHDYEYDINKANQILEEAGYKDTDGDGVREMPDRSQPLTFRLNWPSDSADAELMAELLGEMWRKIGVTLQAQAMDADTLTAVCCPAFDFDLIIWYWTSDPDPNLLLSVMTTDEISTGVNESGYSNREYDELFGQQAMELDHNRRNTVVWRMQRIVHEDVVYIIPYYTQNVQAYRKDRFTGWVVDQPKLDLADVTSLLVVTPVE